MSEYFAGTDNDQSFEMPSEDKSFTPSDANLNQQDPQPAPYDPAEDNSQGKKQDLIYLGLMAVIILVMGYTLYSMFFSGRSSRSAEAAQTAVENLNQPESEPPVIANPPEVSPPPPVTVPEKTTPVENSEMTSQEKKLISNDIEELKSENSYLQAQMRKLTNENESLKNSIVNLESEVDDMVTSSEKMQSQLTDIQKKLEPVVKKPTKVGETYKLEAVVEGRAWLVSSSGANITVKIGDNIKDYGTVTRIDALNSIVYTSSNKQIKVN